MKPRVDLAHQFTWRRPYRPLKFDKTAQRQNSHVGLVLVRQTPIAFRVKQ